MTDPTPPSHLGLPQAVRAGPFSRFLWFCAGADASLLVHCPHSDRVKYQGIGGIVLATAVLAFTSGSYAFYTVFSPKDQMALGTDVHGPTVLQSVAAGFVWALIIFNIDRFIVSSTGKGDGSDTITWTQLSKAFPRIVMAVIIGVCISAPLEIRVLKPEIDAQLELEQNEYLSRLNAHTDRLIEARRAELRTRVAENQRRLDERADYFEKRRLEIKEQRRLLELEAEGKTGSQRAGRGPAWQDKRDTLDKMEQELERDRERDKEKHAPLEDEQRKWKGELEALDRELADARASNLKQARSLDGLLKRIQVSHDIGGSVPWWIMLLLLAIETGPIFFKMMLVRSAYDYLDENLKRLAAARTGVEALGYVFTADGNLELRDDRFHQAEAQLAAELERLKLQAELTREVHARFGEQARRDIAADPKRYVQTDEKAS
ncbi:MAG: DUF4407 domain-containing protein [Myxococcaceae bacterium]|jgi:hypothetical protein|nr:DUF4407 domain-containing protein [Myxococcaceae bacterium]MCA3011331.1 DUF4407 domain-containing protein [Myxococcaceae bacterium]